MGYPIIMSEKFCLKWNDFQSNVSKSFGLFRNEDYLHDVTLVSDDHSKLPAHKLILSACSSYFKDIFKNSPNSHPIICLDGISQEDLKNIMDYIYDGEVQILQENLDRFLNVAQRLKLEGLIGGKSEPEEEMHLEGHKEHFQFVAKEETVDQTLNYEKKETRRKIETKTGTIAVTGETNGNNEQVLQYMEKCSDGNYRCTVCGKTSDSSKNQRNNMMSHVETHLEGLTYSCSLCHKNFRTKN